MDGVVELDLGLHRKDGHVWLLDARCTLPAGDQVHIRHGETELDLALLEGLLEDADAYGRQLSESLFATPEILEMFSRAIGEAERNKGLRLRVIVGPDAGELHGLRWETLRDPGRPDTPLLIRDDVLFSRYLESHDWGPVGLRPRPMLRSLLVVANPRDLGSYQVNGVPLAPIDVPAEVARVRQLLGATGLTVLGEERPATLENLRVALREPYDLVQIVAHGVMVMGEPQLFLEQEDSSADRIKADRLVELFGAVRERPRLVVLVSCQSAGVGTASPGQPGALAALGPRLAATGVPAVVAMQGNLSMETAERFLPVFFSELMRDGRIDRAMSVARGAVRERPDWWMPALFMRLRSGRVWYQEGFAADHRFERWPAVFADLANGKCTPILGSGLTDRLLGTQAELAARWAQRHNFPLDARFHEDLPQVAQYLAVNQNQDFPRQALAEHVRREIVSRFGDSLTEVERSGPLEALLSIVGAHLRETHIREPHKLLAALPFPMYLTTSPTDLLGDALRAAGKKPETELCQWNDKAEWPRSVYQQPQKYKATPEQPLVFHLFGQVSRPESVVVTEDDYFDYLIGSTRGREDVPDAVRVALSDASLLFLGFHMEDWEFRVLFRTIMNQQGWRPNRHTHVAVQIDPEQSQTMDPERVRRYFESYFEGGAVTVYWGSVEAFLDEFSRRWEEWKADRW